jgi:hypothetical protein
MPHIKLDDLNKIQDALMSREVHACLVAQGIISVAKDAVADPAMIRAAELLHANDEVEIDDDAGTSQGDTGTWVQAWVWVPLPEAEERDEPQFINHYDCPCGNAWTDQWTATCDDDCPACGTTCEPTRSEELRREPRR